MEVNSTITEKIVKKTIIISLESEEEVKTFNDMIRDIDPKHCYNTAIANELRNILRKELTT